MILADWPVFTSPLDYENPKVTAADEGGSVNKGGVPGGDDRRLGEKAMLGSHGQAASGRSRSKLGVGGNGDVSCDGADFLVTLITHTIDAFEYSFYFHLTLDLGHLPLKLNVF